LTTQTWQQFSVHTASSQSFLLLNLVLKTCPPLVSIMWRVGKWTQSGCLLSG